MLHLHSVTKPPRIAIGSFHDQFTVPRYYTPERPKTCGQFCCGLAGGNRHGRCSRCIVGGAKRVAAVPRVVLSTRQDVGVLARRLFRSRVAGPPIRCPLLPLFTPLSRRSHPLMLGHDFGSSRVFAWGIAYPRRYTSEAHGWANVGFGMATWTIVK